MQSIDASVFATALLRLAMNDAIFVAVLAIIAAPLMKYFARQIPFVSCALIFFVASYVVSFVFIFGWIALRLVGITFPNELSGATVFAAHVRGRVAHQPIRCTPLRLSDEIPEPRLQGHARHAGRDVAPGRYRLRALVLAGMTLAARLRASVVLRGPQHSAFRWSDRPGAAVRLRSLLGG